MSMPPPPGWYPDPSAPSTQRWWDGTAWTEHRRAAQAPEPSPQAAPPHQPATGPVGFGPVAPMPTAAPGSGPGRGKTLAWAAAALVVVAAVVVGIVLMGGGEGSEASPTDPTTSPATADATSPTGTPTSSPSPSATDDPSIVTDDLNGITLPVLKGWTKAEYTADDTVLLTTEGIHDCPGEGDLCRSGTVASATVTGTDSTDPKTIARRDIPEAANQTFDADALDQQPYGGIVSHRQIKAGSVAVAGRAGYMVRWFVKTEKGPGGYVESLVFPSSVGTESLVCVRFAFEAGKGAPPLSDMDKLTQGIRSVDDAATGGGAGTSVAPSR